MNISNFDYQLPKNFIANEPASPRDHSKLMVIKRSNRFISHDYFYNLPDFLTHDDVLVFNKSKVFPARLYGKRKTGGKAEILLLKPLKKFEWEAITKPGFNVGDSIFFEGFTAKVLERINYITNIQFSVPITEMFNKLKTAGKTPLPPYIKSDKPENILRKQYQTVYAKEYGSSAAPTAGLHFTNRLLKKLRTKGVGTEFVTLHVGLGTFAPVKEENIKKHKIHFEDFNISKASLNRLNESKSEGKRIIAVGTTATRVLETLSDNKGRLDENKLSGSTDLFIYPPYKFNFVDAMITNFHLPKSTLLALVCAFVSHPNTGDKFKDFPSSFAGEAYTQAKTNHYRFFSFGDAMFII